MFFIPICAASDSGGMEFVMELSELCFEDRTAAKRDAEIRNDWSAALGSGKRIEDISADIDWAFTDEDIKELAWLHKECIHRKKIE
ncbi:hypothetical protein [Selenomonas sp. AE3005]|uniref:hypothetical protein n=1 Tax=Selenomonas sp. AE3005 TaxID=1485543 RepID=UPI0025F9A071|nr:hypothetical protein [Selenomonas sp. AE3005]